MNPKIHVENATNENSSCVTFTISDEDHTLGNALRYIIMRNPRVAFCGYSIPHPSEKKMHLRIQTRSNDYSASMALHKGLEDLKELCDVLQLSAEAMVSSLPLDTVSKN